MTSKYYDEHYRTMPVEPWAVVDCLPDLMRYGYYYGNWVKYILRAGHKGDRKIDLAKAEKYLQRLQSLPKLPDELVILTVAALMDSEIADELVELPLHLRLLILPLLGQHKRAMDLLCEL